MLKPILLSVALIALLASVPLAAAQPITACATMDCIAQRVVAGSRLVLVDAQPRYQAAQEILLRNLAEATNQVAAEALAQWIWASRNDAVRGGVNPIPMKLRAQLAGYFPAALLDRVRYRVGIGNDLALPSNAFRANAAAITLNDVIAFRDGNDATSDAKLWAHELTHVQQYERWGVRGFAKRYTLDHKAVEREAEANAEKIIATQPAR